MHTPSLGIFHMRIDSAGNGLLTEDAVRTLLVASGGDAAILQHELRLALGEAWDEELEPYRERGSSESTIFALPQESAG